MAIDWSALVFTPQWMSNLDRLALRRFSQPGLAEEASAYVIEKLSLDDWAACHKFSGQAKPETYLLTVCQNLLEEFSRKRFGRPRPPEWLKREGELWVRVWKMVCLERQAVPSVMDKIAPLAERIDLTQIIRTIKGRLPWCGSSAREIPADSFCSTETDQQPEIVDDGIETQLHAADWEDALQLLFSSLLTTPQNNSPDVKESVFDFDSSPSELKQLNTNASLNALRQQLDLDAQERLLLKMVYQDGLKLTLVAKALNLPSYQPGRLLKGIHERIRLALASVGINQEALNFE